MLVAAGEGGDGIGVEPVGGVRVGGELSGHEALAPAGQERGLGACITRAVEQGAHEREPRPATACADEEDVEDLEGLTALQEQLEGV